MNILVTGSNGFIGKNLVVFLKDSGFNNISTLTRDDNEQSFKEKLQNTDFIFHLAGVNRPTDVADFEIGNTDLTKNIVDILINEGRNVPIVYASSVQAELTNAYGNSKASAENILKDYNNITGNQIHIYRLPNVFGKWSKPNYNSVVATFCYNTINDIPVTIHNKGTILELVYIDDVCNSFLNLLGGKLEIGNNYKCIEPLYKVSLEEIVTLLNKFKNSRNSLVINKVGVGFERALYSTYLSFLKPEHFTYTVPSYEDDRGKFSEILKTPDSGQFSFFTAHPGVTRGGHYHHTKNEKFLVIKGTACFKFKHIITGEEYELTTSDKFLTVVETVPGWIHDITNNGSSELVVFLWANEVFDRAKPDTISMPVRSC